MKLLAIKTIAQERYNLCKSCDKFTSLKICSVCNCIMPIKVKIASAVCPVGKWLQITTEELTDDKPYDDLN
jgi:hypothetical protein